MFPAVVQVPGSYCVEAQFAVLPADDKDLEEWLRGQPGVVSHTVTVRRSGPDRRLLKVRFIQVQNLLRQPPFPDLDTHCTRLGFERPDGPFRDCVDRYD